MRLVLTKILFCLLTVSLISNAYFSAAFANEFMPEDCMMAMMDDDANEQMTSGNMSSMDHCNCSLNGIECQRCDTDFLNSSAALLKTYSLALEKLSNNFVFFDNDKLLSIALANLSPPPIS